MYSNTTLWARLLDYEHVFNTKVFFGWYNKLDNASTNVRNSPVPSFKY